MLFLNYVSYILSIIGGLNWGLYGIFGFNLVGWIGGGSRSAFAIIVYVLVLLAAIWLIISPLVTGTGLILANKKKHHKPTTAEAE